MQHKLWLWLAALAAGNAAAQSGARPDPADPHAKVPETFYRSAFDGYQPLELQKQAPWREANDEVGRIGGHAGTLRGEQGQDKDARGHGAGGREPSGPAGTQARPDAAGERK